jgi:hypothetical protein
MAHLANRENWERAANQAGASLRDTVYELFKTYLNEAYPDEFLIIKEPRDLRQIYFEADHAINPRSYEKPANPTKKDIWFDEDTETYMTMGNRGPVFADGGGCIPDIKIQHRSGKSYFIECKQQNDAGNAHERAAKFATASMIQLIQKHSRVNYHPVGWIFSGSLVEKRKYILELRATYAFAPMHLLLWNTQRIPIEAVQWLEQILPLIRSA